MLLNETQRAIQDAVRDFAQDRIRPQARAFEAAGGYPKPCSPNWRRWG